MSTDYVGTDYVGNAIRIGDRVTTGWRNGRQRKETGTVTGLHRGSFVMDTGVLVEPRDAIRRDTGAGNVCPLRSPNQRRHS